MTAKPGFDIEAITKVSRLGNTPSAEPPAQQMPASQAALPREREGEGATIEMPPLEQRRRRLLILVDDEMRRQIDAGVDLMRRGSVQKFVYEAIAEKLIREGHRKP